MNYLVRTAVAFAFCLQPAFAQEATTPIPAAEFISQVAMSDQFEIESSQVARQKGTSQSIKSYAEHLIDDHTKSSMKLMTLAREAGIAAQAPGTIANQHQQVLDQLGQMSGKEFDQAFAKTQAQAHQQAIQLFTAYAQSGDNEALRRFAVESLPALQQHLQMAESQTLAQQ